MVAVKEGAGPAPFKMARLGSHSLIYGLGILLSKAVAFVMLPLYTRVLSPADYGVLQLIAMTIDIAAIFAGSRIAAGVFHFYHKATTPEGRRAVLSTALHVLIVTYGAAAVVMLAAAPAIARFVFGTEEHTLLLRIATLSLALECLIQVPIARLQLEQRSKAFVTMNAAKLGLQVVFNVIFLVPMHMGPAGVLLSTLIANTFIGLGYSIRLVQQIGLAFSFSAAKDLLRFGTPFVATQVATFIATFGDRYFLNRAADVSAVGIYGLAYQFGFLLANLGYLPFSRVWDPVRFEVAKRADRDAVFQRTFVYMNVALLTAAVGLALFVGDFLRIVATREFFGAAALVPLILLAYVLQSWTLFHNFGMLITERTGAFTVANWVGAAVAVLGYVFLIPAYQAWGAAWATVLSFAVREGMVYLVAQRLWPIRFQWGPVARLLGAAGATTAVGMLLPPLSVVWSLAARGTLLALYLAGVWRLGILSDGDRAFMKRLLTSPRLALAGFTGRA